MLPLAEARSRAVFADVVRAAGFSDVQVRSLPEIREIEADLACQVGDRVDLVDQFLVTATAR